MSLLPQRKKAPEEIAKLRESLGIPGLPLERESALPPLPADDLAPTLSELPDGHSNESIGLAPLPAAVLPEQALQSCDTLPVLPIAELQAVKPSAAPPNSKLPKRRHSDEELNDIRRREALAMLNPLANPRLVAAHPALLASGYLSSLAAAAAIAFYQQPIAVSAPCASVPLLIAGFIALTKPLSRHHAAFIAILAFFVIVFGALHYFPQLRHAT